MSKKRRRAAPPPAQKRSTGSFGLWLGSGEGCPCGYTKLSELPEIQTACLRIAELIGSMTIYLMSNTDQGDERIQNELSRMVDITPNGTMTRMHWMTAIVMNLLLYGDGNSVVVPHTYEGILKAWSPLPLPACPSCRWAPASGITKS